MPILAPRFSFALALGLLAIGPARPELASKSVMDQVSRTILQVVASNCEAGGERSGTAFVWPTPTQAITALHVVAGCNISVYSETARRNVDATISNVSNDADLALLTLNEALPVQPAKLAASDPELNDDLSALGYALRAQHMLSKCLKVGYGLSSSLNDLLPPADIRDVGARGSPMALSQVIGAFANYFHVSDEELHVATYDVWVHAESGAAVALPADANFIETGGTCLFRDRDGFEIRMVGNRVANLLEAIARGVVFEVLWMNDLSRLSWQRNWQWTYPLPHVDAKKGLVVNRAAWNGLDLRTPVAFTGETHMFRAQSSWESPWLMRFPAKSRRPSAKPLNRP